MTTFVLDAGELIGLEHGSRAAWLRLDEASKSSDEFVVPTGVIVQVWRGTPRQARLNQALKKCQPIPLDEETARLAGQLCGRTGTSDVTDAVVAAVAHSAQKRDDTVVLTSDPQDIRALLAAIGSTATVLPV